MHKHESCAFRADLGIKVWAGNVGAEDKLLALIIGQTTLQVRDGLTGLPLQHLTLICAVGDGVVLDRARLVAQHGHLEIVPLELERHLLSTLFRLLGKDVVQAARLTIGVVQGDLRTLATYEVNKQVVYDLMSDGFQ